MFEFNQYRAFLVLTLLFCCQLVAKGKNDPKYDSVLQVLQHQIDTSSGGDKIQGYLNIADFVRRSHPAQAIGYMDSILSFAKEKQDTQAFAVAYANLGNTYHFLADHEMAIEYANKAALLFQQLGKHTGLIDQLIGSGVYYKEMEQDSMAMVKYQEALAIFIKHPEDSSRLASLLSNMAVVYQELGEETMDTALVWKAIGDYKKVLAIDRRHGGPYWTSKTLNNLGNSFNSLGMMTKEPYLFDSALYYFRWSIRLKKKVNDQNGLSLTYGNVGLTLNLLGRQDSAVFYRRLSLEIAQITEIPQAIINGYEGLMRQMASDHSYEQAYKFSQKFIRLKDSMLTLEMAEKIATMQGRYDIERKEFDNQRLTIENTEKELELVENERQRYLLFGGLGLLLLIIIFGYLYLRQRQKTQLQIEASKQQKLRFKAIIEAEEKERVRVAQELHDGLGQMLTAAKLNLEGVEEVADPEDQQLVENAISIIDGLITEVRHISHNMMPAGLIELGLINAVRTLAEKVNESKLLSVQFKYNEDSPRFEQSIEIALYRVVQEVLNNMIKHAQAKKIYIELQYINNKVNLLMSDDGKGFDTDTISQSKGIGWKNIFSRLSLIDGKINIDSAPGKGTTVNIDVVI